MAFTSNWWPKTFILKPFQGVAHNKTSVLNQDMNSDSTQIISFEIDNRIF